MNDTKEKENEWKARELGALWAREGKNQNYFSGYVTVGELGFEKKIKIVGFKNNFKDSENHPDFRLYVSEDREAQSGDKPQTTGKDKTDGEDQELI
jgi:uncharacterized protein (DUF736 family)